MPPSKTPARSSSKPARHPKTLAGEISGQPSQARAAILTKYQAAVTYMQQGDFTAAHPALEELLREAPADLTDRIRMYLAACIAQAGKGDHHFKTAEEQYDYAISLLNDGQYEDARDHLNDIIRQDKNADYGFYGLALLASMTGDSESCLEKLTEAIRLNAHNRFQARSDSDFQTMSDDPRFTELLYPDA